MELGIKTSLFDVASYGEIKEADDNPFLEAFHVDKQIVIKRFKKGEVVIPEIADIPIEESMELTKENELLKKKGLEIGKRHYKQKADFVIIYRKPHILNYKDLSEAAFKIFFLILDSKLSLGIDYVVMSLPELCVELGMTRPTISKGMVELVRNKLIYKRTDTVWWVNPNYFFAGNRLNIKTK